MHISAHVAGRAQLEHVGATSVAMARVAQLRQRRGPTRYHGQLEGNQERPIKGGQSQ